MKLAVAPAAFVDVSTLELHHSFAMEKELIGLSLDVTELSKVRPEFVLVLAVGDVTIFEGADVVIVNILLDEDF